MGLLSRSDEVAGGSGPMGSPAGPQVQGVPRDPPTAAQDVPMDTLQGSL